MMMYKITFGLLFLINFITSHIKDFNLTNLVTDSS
jgi:hypothetical protein